MAKRIKDEAEEKAKKLLLRKIVEKETAKFIARGGKIKDGPRVENSTGWSTDTKQFDIMDIAPG